MRLFFPCRKHGPFCTGGPMHSPLIPIGPIEGFVARFFPPHTWEEARKSYADHIEALRPASDVVPGDHNAD